VIKEIRNYFQHVIEPVIQPPSALLTVILLLLISAFIFLVFKNIQYPLLWNDEGDTVVFGQQVLRYGYPKIHGEKNVIYHFIGALPDLAVKKSIDAHILGNWGHYYFVTPFLLLANLANNVYLKTAILRIPFATLPLVSILLFGKAISNILPSPRKRILFNIFYLILEILSLFVILEIRQVRHHPLVLFLSLLLLINYINQTFLRKIKTLNYIVVSSFLLFFIFTLYYPVYFIFVITLFIYEVYIIPKPLKLNLLFVKKIFSGSTVVSILTSLFFVIPLFFYFEIPRVSLGLNNYFQFGIQSYLQNIFFIAEFLFIFEYFGIVIFLQAYLYSQRRFVKNNTGYKISNLLFFFVCIYILFISRSPFMSSRYLVTLQPVIAATLTINMFLLFHINRLKKRLSTSLGIVFIVALLIVGSFYKLSYLINYFYEITHQYKGVIDYIVPYIKSNYKDPQNLVIATNYEEEVLMYYLDSKVVVGYAGKNIGEDLKLNPDIIIPRKSIKNYQKEIQYLIDKGNYRKTSFEVYDYPVNNIQELFYGPRHLFSTKYATKQSEMLEIYEKIQ
jgi:hypothetical protein